MISVVYIPRTGSKFFSQQIAEEAGYEWLGEVLNPRTFPHANIRRDMRKRLIECPDVVIKLGVWQTELEGLRAMLSLSEKVYFCVRADFDQQVKSFYAATDPIVDNYHAQIEHADIPYNSVRYIQTAEWLEHQYRESVKLLDGIDHALIWYESFATPEGKYARNFVWSEEPPKLSFNVKEFLQENQ